MLNEKKISELWFIIIREYKYVYYILNIMKQSYDSKV